MGKLEVQEIPPYWELDSLGKMRPGADRGVPSAAGSSLGSCVRDRKFSRCRWEVPGFGNFYTCII